MTRGPATTARDPGGSAGGFGVYWDRPLVVPGSFSTIAPVPGLFSVGGAMAATGRAVDWFRVEVLRSAATTATLIEEAGAIPPGADGVVFLPYLAGERSPLWDPTARGAFAGLALGHGRGHLTRAILEASAFAIRHVAESIVAAGVEVGSMRVCGGPARSETWNQIKADVTGYEGTKVIEAMTRAVPMKRLGRPEDVAAAVRFLASEEAGFITGQTLSVSGGLTMA